MADITITPNDTLELTYSVSNYTNELDEILNINILTDSDEENTKSDITSNINDADVFYWQPSENDVGGEYEFELSNNTSITVEIIDIPNIKNLQSRYVAEELDLSEGDPVSTWYDLEGDFNGHQETSGVQPTFRDDDLNNLATVEFNRDYLLTGHNQNSNEESSIYIVARVDDTSENRGIYGAGGSGSGNRHYIRMQDNPNWQVGFGGTADISSSATSGEWKIFGFNAGPMEIFAFGLMAPKYCVRRSTVRVKTRMMTQSVLGTTKE